MDHEILTAYCRDERDKSPLQFISAELLAHYRKTERIAWVLGTVMVAALTAGAILLACS